MCHSSEQSVKPKISDREGNVYLLIFLLLQMSKVSWYKQRLKALLFKARFADKVEEIKPVRNKLSLLVSLCLGLPDRSEITSAVREPQPSNKPLVKSLRSRLFTF